ncbi:MAG: alpha-2-macroglobulin [Bradyrhizobium sp.]|nr:alpha-2-macroglobulin [Bradyrhizobium sp.]
MRNAGAWPGHGAGGGQGFRRDDLADSALKLEARIKSEAGPVAKSGASLRTDADAAFKRSDFRTGLQIIGQIAATAPEDSGNWLRLARTIFQIRPSNSSEQTFLMERASTAAYIAYQRAGNAGGVLPMTMLVNGVSVGEIDGRRQRLVDPPGPGFARLTMIDATGAADTVVIRIQ